MISRRTGQINGEQERCHLHSHTHSWTRKDPFSKWPVCAIRNAHSPYICTFIFVNCIFSDILWNKCKPHKLLCKIKIHLIVHRPCDQIVIWLRRVPLQKTNARLSLTQSHNSLYLSRGPHALPTNIPNISLRYFAIKIKIPICSHSSRRTNKPTWKCNKIECKQRAQLKPRPHGDCLWVRARALAQAVEVIKS